MDDLKTYEQARDTCVASDQASLASISNAYEQGNVLLKLMILT